ncbi:MAG: aminoglycoside 3'-phosphotransferase [Myxococcales bacterium]|nr:aminoglycoside 3'-phosphotransferase [Myxococcales bacterium]
MTERSPLIVPDALRDEVVGFERERTALGQAAETYRLTAGGRPTRYLKVAGTLEHEHERLRWATGRLPVPRVLAFATEAGRDYLLLDELPGTPVELATDRPVPDRVAHLAQTLRWLHQVPVAECPFEMRARVRMIDAEANVRAGHVDESDFDDQRAGRSAMSVLAELRAWPAFEEDVVLTHGDFTLANVFIEPAGLLDLGRLGVADRYQDLALVLRDIEGAYGPDWRVPFVRAYGLDAVDESKLAFFRLLDELF